MLLQFSVDCQGLFHIVILPILDLDLLPSFLLFFLFFCLYLFLPFSSSSWSVPRSFPPAG